MKNERKIRNVLYVLLIIGLVLLASNLEYKQIQEDVQAQTDCRVKDNEDITPKNIQ